MRKISFNEAQCNFPTSKITQLRKIKTPRKIIGQERAVQALKMGLGLDAAGFNIFVMGASGTGRRSTVNEIIKDFKPNYKKLCDIAYVYNFKKPLEPDAVFFPGGEGLNFKNKLKQAVTGIVSDGEKLLQSEAYLSNSSRVINESNTNETELLINFESQMQKKGFKLVQIKQENASSTFDLNPIIDGKETSFSELRTALEEKKISKKAFNAIQKEYYVCVEMMNDLFDAIKNNQLDTQNKLKALLNQSIQPIIKAQLKPLFDLAAAYEKKYTEDGKEHSEKLRLFLQNIQKSLEDKVRIFTAGFKHASSRKKFLLKYDINLICENSDDKNYVITENLPSFANLFGLIESTSISEMSVRDAHMRISAGAVHRAFGGYLIVRLQDLLTEEDSYFYLKRVLQSGKIEIQVPAGSTNTINIFKPVAIPARFKVILIGESYSYDSMYQTDPDFSKLFKICAEFSPVMIRNEENEAAFISFIDTIARKYRLPKIANSAYAKLLSYACELAGSRNFISTQFTKISDLMLQTNLTAQQCNAKIIDEKMVSETLKRVRFLSSLPEQEYLDDLQCGVVFLTVSGKKIGSINGLAVQDRGYFSFGVPEVITAQSSPGEIGVVNIESEVGFSGEVYDKAHLIISSLLKNTYARDMKLSVDASLCFEQSYGMIEGDSASCAEFLALLSSIAEIPLRQDLAITGSLNQHGDVQPIGGVSEKISGFYNACKILGLTGTQGVVIPESNAQDLFLSEEVLEAIKEGRFTIYAISKIDEAVHIFTECDQEEISKAVQARLEHFNRIMKRLVRIERE